MRCPRLFVFLLLFFSLPLSAKKVKLFGKYDFSQGGYAITGLLSESGRNGLRDSLGEFFTEDVALLEEFKSAWVFEKESPLYACGYHYEIYLSRNGEKLERFLINLDCNMLRTEDGAYFFETALLRRFFGRLKEKPVHCSGHFPSLERGRAAVDSIRKSDGFLFFPWIGSSYWLKHDGEFEIQLIDSVRRFDANGFRELTELMNDHFQQLFPGENFYVDVFGSYGPPGVPSEYELRIYGSKSLYEKIQQRFKVKKEWKELKASIGYVKKTPCLAKQ